MRLKYLAAAAALMVTAHQGAVTPAHSEEIIHAVYRITLTDPASGANFISQRWSSRSFPSVEACMRQRDSFKGVHLDALKEYGFVNASGAPLAYKVEAVDCRKQ